MYLLLQNVKRSKFSQSPETAVHQQKRRLSEKDINFCDSESRNMHNLGHILLRCTTKYCKGLRLRCCKILSQAMESLYSGKSSPLCSDIKMVRGRGQYFRICKNLFLQRSTKCHLIILISISGLYIIVFGV